MSNGTLEVSGHWSLCRRGVASSLTPLSQGAAPVLYASQVCVKWQCLRRAKPRKYYCSRTAHAFSETDATRRGRERGTGHGTRSSRRVSRDPASRFPGRGPGVRRSPFPRPDPASFSARDTISSCAARQCTTPAACCGTPGATTYVLSAPTKTNRDGSTPKSKAPSNPSTCRRPLVSNLLTQ